MLDDAHDESVVEGAVGAGDRTLEGARSVGWKEMLVFSSGPAEPGA